MEFAWLLSFLLLVPMDLFDLCEKDCYTCAYIVPTTTFVSAANGVQFHGLYEFDEHETRTLNCRTVNCIYLLECTNCLCQYVGETVQDLYDRMCQHRCSTKPKGGSGNFRIRQHYACSGGKCTKFKIYIIQKLPGSGRTADYKPNSKKLVIDAATTLIRKQIEDNWIRKLHTQFPYGCNDRIDSLKDKWLYNCEFAKFISPKPKRARSWKKKPNNSNHDHHDIRFIVDSLITILKADFHTSCIINVKRLLFPLKQKDLVTIHNLYVKEVFTDTCLKHEALHRQSHFIITDLLTYKIKPFNSDKISKVNKKKKRILFKLLFINKALDMINLPLIFRNKELKSFVNFCKIREPSIMYSNKPSVGSKLFNYNQTSNNFTNINDIICVCSQFENYINHDCGHVATGDVNIFSNKDIRSIIMKGPKYRERTNIDFERASKLILDNLDNFIQLWADKEQLDKACFEGWKLKFKELLYQSICSLKLKYSNHRKVNSIFDNVSVKDELEYFHNHFVLCPVDKAAKNIAIICKYFYVENLLRECTLNTACYNEIENSSINDIVKNVKAFMKTMNISLVDFNKFPHIIWFPKFHKPNLSQRFVVSYASCYIKPLTSRISLALKAVYNKIINYSNMIFKVTGINRNWIIDNNTLLLDSLGNVEFARSIQTYDFTTLYTNLEHSDIKTALASVIKLAFKHAKCSKISIYEKSFRWVNKPRENTFYFDKSSLMEATNYLIDNCYFTLGNRIFRQIIGVPIGVDPGPFIANLTLWYYENSYLEKLYKHDYFSAKMMGKTFRLIDDITSVNSDGIFGQHISNIYPLSLTLNKENSDDSMAHVLDLNVKINDGKFITSVYDKREDFPFPIVQFSPKDSNIPRDNILGVFQSQIIRYFRISSEYDSFKERVSNIVKKFVELGFDKRLLKSKFTYICRRHNFHNKFKNLNDLVLMFC